MPSCFVVSPLVCPRQTQFPTAALETPKLPQHPHSLVPLPAAPVSPWLIQCQSATPGVSLATSGFHQLSWYSTVSPKFLVVFPNCHNYLQAASVCQIPAPHTWLMDPRLLWHSSQVCQCSVGYLSVPEATILQCPPSNYLSISQASCVSPWLPVCSPYAALMLPWLQCPTFYLLIVPRLPHCSSMFHAGEKDNDTEGNCISVSPLAA